MNELLNKYCNFYLSNVKDASKNKCCLVCWFSDTKYPIDLASFCQKMFRHNWCCTWPNVNTGKSSQVQKNDLKNEYNQKNRDNFKLKTTSKMKWTLKIKTTSEWGGPRKWRQSQEWRTCDVVKTQRNSTQSNSKATSVGVRHSSHLKATHPKLFCHF